MCLADWRHHFHLYFHLYKLVYFLFNDRNNVKIEPPSYTRIVKPSCTLVNRIQIFYRQFIVLEYRISWWVRSKWSSIAIVTKVDVECQRAKFLSCVNKITHVIRILWQSFWSIGRWIRLVYLEIPVSFIFINIS